VRAVSAGRTSTVEYEAVLAEARLRLCEWEIESWLQLKAAQQAKNVRVREAGPDAAGRRQILTR
jgi:hypothetical protein